MLRRIFLSLALATVCLAQDVARMDQIVQSYVANKQFMGSVLVARGSDVLLDKGYGFANLEWNVPNGPSSKYRLGSVTKQFTAACVMLLEERGKLKVEDPVKKYMPDAPAAWDRITIFNLLTHTSGIPNFTSFPEYRKLQPFAKTPEELVAIFRDKPLDFQPGEKWSYSNSGYVLLGYLIEKITGEPYAKFVQENIFTPLGMKDSGYDSNAATIPHRASGYTPSARGIENAGYINMTIPHAAGALYSTTDDLLRWYQGLFGGKLLSPASLTKMTTPFKSDYAFGLSVETQFGHKLIGHGGGIEGFNTFIAYDPDEKLTYVALANLNGGAPQQIVHQLNAVAHGQKVTLQSERKEIKVAPEILSKYVGNYELAPGRTMSITLSDGQLNSQLTGQPKVPIFPESETSFFLKVVDAQLDFGQDAQGAYAVLHQNGRDAKMRKKE
jgi:CubicO group peptidase (beta-lactamase class C family)